ncbi:MAG: hypothetical protein AAGK32_17600 [Actinomycetota bacterium]
MIALLVGAVLPWATVSTGFGSFSKAGTEGDGVLTLVLGLVIGGLALPMLTSRTVKRGLAIGIVIAAGIALAIAIYDIVDVNNTLGDLGEFADGSPGVGLYLTAAGAVAAAAGGVMAIVTGAEDGPG